MNLHPQFLVAAVCATCWTQPALHAAPAESGSVIVHTNAAYKTNANRTPYERERCVLDLYLPAGQERFPTLVWFHGGGLKGGDKQEAAAIARSLARGGLGVVCPNYRLSPVVHYPAYLDDAAAAVAWTRDHVAEYGGDPEQLFVSGHSAGGWLTLMIGLDERYLHRYALDCRSLAGLIPVSGQTMTHSTVREERGVGRFTIVADDAAPVHHVHSETAPLLLLYADNDLVARREENEYLLAVMKGAGHPAVDGLLVRDRDHGSVAFRIADETDPARAALLKFVEQHSKPAEAPAEPGSSVR